MAPRRLTRNPVLLYSSTLYPVSSKDGRRMGVCGQYHSKRSGNPHNYHSGYQTIAVENNQVTANTRNVKHAERYDDSPVSIAVEKILTRADSEDSLGGARGGRDSVRGARWIPVWAAKPIDLVGADRRRPTARRSRRSPGGRLLTCAPRALRVPRSRGRCRCAAPGRGRGEQNCFASISGEYLDQQRGRLFALHASPILNLFHTAQMRSARQCRD